ncbi:MAG: MCE family protein [Candidatus Rokubacteria bacterium]|nr:MCE family protein [Candidatus Rokubacteria bacterium]
MVDDKRGMATQLRVGVFVLIAFAVFLGLIYMLGARARLFEAKYTLYSDFTEVGGLMEGATVRLAGVQIGRVTAVRLPGQPGGKVRVEMRIASQYADRIRKNSVARIETQGLLGDKILEISVGLASEPAVPPGAVLASREPTDLSHVIGQSSEVVANVTALTQSLRETAETLNQSKVVQDFAATAVTARRVTEQIESGRGLLHALVYEEPAALRRLDRLLISTQAILDRAERGEGALGVLTSRESTEAARRFVRAMDRFGQAMDQKSGESGLVPALLFDPKYKSLADDLQVLAKNFREVSDRLAGGQGVLGGLLKEEPGSQGLNQVSADLRVAVHNLRQVTEKLNSGQGTLGALLVDPTVYENLSAVLEGTQRSSLLRSLIRGLGNKGREAKSDGKNEVRKR